MREKIKNITVLLSYTSLENNDTIAVNTKIINNSGEAIKLKRICSLCFDLRMVNCIFTHLYVC